MCSERLFWLQDIDLVPSHVVPSLTVDKEHNDVYSAYNKPGAVMYWLRVCPLLTCIWHPRLASQATPYCTGRLQPRLAHNHASCQLLLLILTCISWSGAPASRYGCSALHTYLSAKHPPSFKCITIWLFQRTAGASHQSDNRVKQVAVSQMPDVLPPTWCSSPLITCYWVQDVHPTEDFILVIDADMIMRQPFDPVALGAGPGWAISAFFTYMKGVSNELAMRHVPQVVPRNDTLAGQPGRRGDQVGGFTLMHTKDLERVAPLWLSFTTAVRNDPTVSVHDAMNSWALLMSECTCPYLLFSQRLYKPRAC